MLKQLTIAILFMATVFTAISCKKTNDIAESGKSKYPTNVHKISETYTVGELHNTAVKVYKAKYGFVGNSGGTRDSVIVIAQRVSDIVDSLLDTSSDYGAFSSQFISSYDSLGMFNLDGTIKGTIFVLQTTALIPANGDLRTALYNVNSHIGDTTIDFIAYAQGQMAALTLSGNDAEMAQGFNDIIGNSEELEEVYGSKGKTAKEIKDAKDAVKAADADGYAGGFTLGWLYSGGNLAAAQMWAIKAAVAYSVREAAYQNL